MKNRAASNQAFTNEEVRDLLHQALQAVAYVHRNGYMHRDIKPENFLISEGLEGQILKLADFGLARSINDHQSKLTEYVSTRWYRAPELALSTLNYNQSVDIFALGAMMAEMYLGRPLFPGRTEQEQLIQIFSVMGTPK
jgi:protein kinase